MGVDKTLESWKVCRALVKLGNHCIETDAVPFIQEEIIDRYFYMDFATGVCTLCALDLYVAI